MGNEQDARLVVAAWVHRITRDLRGTLDWTKLFAGTTADPERKLSLHRVQENGKSWSWETESEDIACRVVDWLWEIGCEGRDVHHHETGRHVYLYRMVKDVTREELPPPPEALRTQRILSFVEKITAWAGQHGGPGEVFIGITSSPENTVRELLRENPGAVYRVWDVGTEETARVLLRHFRKMGYGGNDEGYPLEASWVYIYI